MLGRRRRRQPSIESTLGRAIVFFVIAEPLLIVRGSTPILIKSKSWSSQDKYC